MVKNIIQKHSGPLVLVFVDLTAAYDHIPREFLFRVLEFRTGAKILVYILRKLYDGTKAYISGTKTHFDILVGCRQGGLESPTLFNYYFDFVLKFAQKRLIAGILMDGAFHLNTGFLANAPTENNAAANGCMARIS